MSLTTETAKSTRVLTYFVRIYTTPGTYSGANVILQASDPTSATGVPGVDGLRISKSFDSPVPVCQIDLSRVPTWITRGQGVTVDVGYNGLTQRLFTGFIQSRERRVGKGTIQCMGRLWTAFRTVQISERDVDGDTVATAIGDILDYVGITDNRSLTIPAFTLGTASSPKLERMPASQMLQTLMDIDGCRIYELGTGQIVIRVIDEAPAPTAFKTYTTNSNATARVLEASDREDPEYYRNKVIVTGATITEGTAPDETSRTITATATNTGSALVQPALPTDTFLEAEYNNHLIDTDAKAAEVAIRLLAKFARIPRQLQIEIAGDPELELGQTLAFVMPELDLNDRGFVSGIEHSIDSNGYVTRLTDFRGAGDTGGTLAQNPIAAFTFKSEVEVFGATTNVFASLDASNSFDPDGTIASYAWSDNQTTTPEIATLTTAQVTVRADTSAWTGSWDVTLTVTDNDGLTGTTTITVPYENTEAEIVIPAVYAAINNRHSASLDGALTWNDQTVGSGNSISCGARAADGVNFGHAIFGTSTGRIYRTTDGCATAPTLVYTSAAGVAMNDVQWDWRNGNVCWAVDENAIVYISLNAGVTWVIYDELRTETFAGSAVDSTAFLTAGGIYTGDGIDGRTITGLGFQPDMVMVKQTNASGSGTWFRTSNMSAGLSRSFIGSAPRTDAIKSLDADGFTLGIHTDVNEGGGSAGTYRWFAIKDAGGLGANMKFGSYTGNNPSTQSITGVGWTPAMVIAAGGSGSGTDIPHFKTTSMSSADSRTFAGDGAAHTNSITSLDADGFTVGARLDTNTGAQLYYYVAFRASNSFKVGSYSGNSTDDRNLTNFALNPDWAMVRSGSSDTNAHARWRGGTASHPDSNSSGFAATTADNTDAIQSLLSGGIQVGADDDVNESGVTYYWAAIDASVSLTPGTVPGALGNKLGLPAAGGVYVFGGTGAGSPLITFDPVVGSHNWIQQTFTGDLLTDTVTTPGDATLRIIDASAGYAGTAIILAWSSGGGASITAVYYTTSTPGPTAAYTRASTTFGGLKTGRYIVSDNVLIKSDYFIAAFANRSVWISTDGIAWTEVTNVMPASVTPNHCIGMTGSTELTGIVGMFGVFMIAASDGIYKYTPRIDATASYVRGGTGAGTALPASAVPKKLSIGAPVGATTSGTGRVALVKDSGGATTKDVSYINGATWTTVALPAQIDQSRPNITCLTTLDWVVTDVDGFYSQDDVSACVVTHDGGATWASSPIGDEDLVSADKKRGIEHVCVAADGRWWGLRTAGTNDTHPIRIHVFYSDNLGATWNAHTNGTLSVASAIRRAWRIVAHPTNPNVIAILAGKGDPGVAVNVLTHYTADRGATAWTTNDQSVFKMLGDLNVGVQFTMLNTNRIVGSYNPSAGQTTCWTTDNFGVLWTLRQTITNTQDTGFLTGGTASKLVLFHPTGTLISDPKEVYVSTNQGQTFTLVDDTYPIQDAGENWSAKYDIANDTLVVVNNDVSGAGRVMSFSPVSADGVWNDITFNLPAVGATLWDGVAVIP